MQVAEVYADVLCVGGGIAGLMAAIRASELGAKTVVADKSNTLYSGSGGLGMTIFAATSLKSTETTSGRSCELFNNRFPAE